MKQIIRCVLIGVVVLVLFFVFLMAFSFPSLHYYEMGFPMSRTTGDVETDKVYHAGRYILGPDKKFKTFLSSVHFEHFSLSKVSTADKLEIGLNTYFQYFLRPHQLGLLHEKFDRYYRPILKTNALDALKNTAVYYTLREYIRERERVENALETAVRERLSGKCCLKGCGGQNTKPCLEDCKPYETCDTEDYGLFADMPLFQLAGISIPQEISKRFENALLLHEKNEEAKLRQQSTVIRKETDKKSRLITNLAERIVKGAQANATLVRTLAKAEARVLVENSRIQGLNHLYQELNITTDQQKNAYHYLRTLDRSGKARLAIDFQNYIAGNVK